MLIRYLILVALLTGASSAGADLYKCTDPNGKVAFSDRPCEGDTTGEDIEADLPHINSSTPSYGVKQIQRRAQQPEPARVKPKVSREDIEKKKQAKRMMCAQMKADYKILSDYDTCSRSKFANHSNCVMVREEEGGKQYGKIKQEKYRKSLKKRIDRECS